MNLYLCKIISNWIWTICISLFSLMGNEISTNVISVQNKNINKSDPIVTEVIEYDVITKYNSKLPSNKTNILVEGKDGLSYIDKTGTERNLNPVVEQVIEVGTGAQGKYQGNTTGYGADCKGCSGIVSCKSRDGKAVNLKENEAYYSDNQFGNIRILAADLSLFKCGTVVEVDTGNSDPFLGIVMDTGHGMRSSWQKYKKVHFDIAHLTEKDPVVYQATSNNASFSVQRWGW